ncbi:MAG: 2-oxo-4-hydroxy-4-carboxy-5-ureidoimidazoline (OHCU) decarboxylase (EC [uncultured Paraburkholderia sp.]|nr:MAG: 2-oxo-4-hydroxy-4-carboxy-5-ureidoimidazoline (OHCU) decarboxylase (EC [uncultured Paraburkholderia sp.]CAH2942733.1 MAG: 2-oxo-4-hydroxy-4-carboxy-5-ureidoimidazoline (OHCU) decarboxylase (EC [uncultured Paraburkholderia sp.]
MKAMQYTLDQLNSTSTDAFVAALSGIFKHSPWSRKSPRSNGRLRASTSCIARCSTPSRHPVKRGNSR